MEWQISPESAAEDLEDFAEHCKEPAVQAIKPEIDRFLSNYWDSLSPQELRNFVGETLSKVEKTASNTPGFKWLMKLFDDLEEDAVSEELAMREMSREDVDFPDPYEEFDALPF